MDYELLVDSAAGEEVLAVYDKVTFQSTEGYSRLQGCLVVTNRRLLRVDQEPGCARRRLLVDSDYYCQSFDLFWIENPDSLTYTHSGLIKKSISGLEVPFAAKGRLTILADEATVTGLRATLSQLPSNGPCVTLHGSEEVRWAGRPCLGAVPELTGDGSLNNPGLFNGSHRVNVLVTRSSILIYRLDNVASFGLRDSHHVDIALGKPIVQYCRIPLSALLRAKRPRGLVDITGLGYINLVLAQPISILEVPGSTIYPDDDVVLEQEEFACGKCSGHVSGMFAGKAAYGASVGWKCGACARVICTTCRKDHSFFSSKASCPACNEKVVPSAYVDSSLYEVRVSIEVAAEMRRYSEGPRDLVRTYEEYVKRDGIDYDSGPLKNPMKREDNSLLNPVAVANSVLTIRPSWYGKRGKEWSLSLAPFEGNEALWECLVQSGVPS